MLRAATVTDAIRIHDYIQLAFSNGYRLSVYNDFSLTPATRSLNDLESRSVESIAVSEDEVVISLFGGIALSVCLKDECYHGPEAMQINTASGETIVWR